MTNMSEFVSELEKMMPAEELLFEPTPGFGPYKRYFPEDAVQHPAKANTLLIQYLIEKFTQEGDVILDPMAGTFSTCVIAALHGRHGIGIDIEEKFYKWGIEAKRIVEKTQTLTEKGKIAVLRGDARQLSKILKEVDSIVTSPPYSEGIGHDSGDNASEEFKERLELQRRYTRQMTSEGNIAKLKHGEISAIITSPPFEKSNCVRENSEEFWKKAKEMGKRWGSKPPSGTEQKQYSEDNIGNLPFVDTVITSPPYADAKKGEADEEKMAERWDKAAEDKDWNTWSKTWKTEGRKRALKSLGSGYSKSEENIGNLPVGDIDAVITSPPYSGSVNAPNDPERRAERMKKAGLDPKTIVGGKARCGQVDWKYGDSKENIGNLSHGEIDAVITSPPYLKSADAGAGVNRQREGDVKIGCATKGREVSDPEAVDNTKTYGEISEVDFKENKKPTYLSEMFKVYSNMFKVLKKGGRAIVIIKPFIREKKVIDLPYHTWLLMQKAGSKLEKVLKLRLKQESFWRVLYHRRFPNVPKIKHEYIIVARKVM